jgi:hypothetical protein
MKNDQSPPRRSARASRRQPDHARFLSRARFAPAVLTASALFGYLTFGCEPDLDSLSVDFGDGDDGGTPGSGGTDAEGGEGATTAGKGGSSGSSGSSGNGGSSGSSGKGGSGGAAGGSGGSEAGMGGTGGSSSGSSGSGGSSGSSGTGGGTTACTNGSRGANESDVDCGGASECPRCENNLRCTKATDCASDWCFGGRCVEPTCADERQNQDETGVDCGGTCAPASACDDGVACLVNADCASEYCFEDVCTDHCTSNRREADETDVNCGGDDCAPCAGELRCETGPDCESGLCNNNVCTVADCDDNFTNQDESDVDCGGVCTPEKFCEVGDDCNLPSDCDTYVCTAGQCAADIDIVAGDMIDDLEDLNFTVPAVSGRTGGWYPFNDSTATGMRTFENAIIPGQRGADSLGAIRTTGSGFTTWGSGIGFDLNAPGGTKNVYDATGTVGVTFWARSATAMNLTVAFPDVNTTGQLPPEIKLCTSCDHHWLTSVAVGTDWKRFTILYADLVLEGGTVPTPTELAIDQLVSVQWRVITGATYDYWIDDVAFVRE